jgi:hypothetical protein
MTYNTVSIDLDEAEELAILYMESGNIPFLVAPPGVGKTTLVKNIANRMRAKLYCLRLNNIPPEEVSGLQYIDRTGEKTKRLPPMWMPKPDGSDGPTVIFLDELTQAADENRKAIMSALLERYLGDTELPDNCYFIAAGNSAEDGTNVFIFDRATADRFAYIKVKVNHEKFCNDYAKEKNFEQEIVTLIRVRPDLLEMSEEMCKGDNLIGSSPRSWEALDRFLKKVKEKKETGLEVSDMVFSAGIKGKVGDSVGACLLDVIERIKEMKSVQDFLRMDREDRRANSPQSLEAMWMIGQGLIWHSSTLERCIEAFDILDSFEEIAEIPFYETRFNIAETILQRAVTLHEISGVMESRTLQKNMKAWRHQMENPGDDEGVQEAQIKVA